MSRRRSVVLGATAAGLVVLVGCGAPTDGVRAIEGDSVPYELLSSPPVTAEPTETPSVGPTPTNAVASEVYFVDAEDRLVPLDAPTGDGLPEEVVSGLLSELADGPGEDGRADGLSSALGPDASLRLIRILGATAYIEVTNPAREPSASQLPLAAGQIVLTATSANGVSRVVLLTDGVRVDIPLPGGQLTPGPVTAEDYAELVLPTPA